MPRCADRGSRGEPAPTVERQGSTEFGDELQILVGDGAFRSAADELRVFGEDAAGFFRWERRVGGHAGGVVGVRDEEADRIFNGVDFDEVAVFYDAEGAAFRGLWRDVANIETVRAAGEASIGDERHIFDEAATGDGARG